MRWVGGSKPRSPRCGEVAGDHGASSERRRNVPEPQVARTDGAEEIGRHGAVFPSLPSWQTSSWIAAFGDVTANAERGLCGWVWLASMSLKTP